MTLKGVYFSIFILIHLLCMSAPCSLEEMFFMSFAADVIFLTV